MKYLLSALLFSICFGTVSVAQSICLIKTGFSSSATDTFQPLEFDADVLSTVSDIMYAEGNPKYVWVDLVKDGYIKNGDPNWYNLYINPDGKGCDDKYGIPGNVQKTYAKKWMQFVNNLQEPVSKCNYRLSNYGQANADSMTNAQSAFRTIDKSELHHLHLTHKGELRFYKQLAEDGLAPLDKAIDLEFSNKGFFVHGKRLDYEQRTKYMALLKEEFGHNYYNDESFIKIGSLPENTFGEKIAELEEQINNATRKTDK